MKIKEVKTYIVSQKLGEQSFCYSQAWYNTRTLMLLEIITEDGVYGFGEAFGNAFVNKAIIDNVYAPKLIGQHIFDSEKIWDELYNTLRDNGQKGSCIQAISAVDNALWDLKGKYTHLPVYQLLGGARRDKILPYATGFYHTKTDNQEALLVEEAHKYLTAGFKAMKMKIGFGIENDIQMVKTVREAIGPDIKLMVDANHAYTAMAAIKIAQAIEKYDITWFEEPVIPEDIGGYKEVKAATSIPIAGGEAEFTRYGFKRFIDERCVDILQPDCSIMGGLSEAQKIFSMAKIANTQCYPHVWGSAIALQTGMHAAFAMPDFPESLNPGEVLFEYDRTPNIFRDEMNLLYQVTLKDGYIEKPEFEGLGFEPDRDLIAKHLVK
ncbi:mandelate racemase/muconate lactonizing enzyme family protein [Chakrabartyella piscis]|uniref:mandelate racemase/muconate lactonizing enzyme family protein n=1 Tax=Chakrabartyella piscis TaxID=2918914 RepID=UPI002958ADA6|nr:mandelate racemase/muconate lactonizing enzyme family protein [Chakrabartyella piscis]